MANTSCVEKLFIASIAVFPLSTMNVSTMRNRDYRTEGFEAFKMRSSDVLTEPSISGIILKIRWIGRIDRRAQWRQLLYIDIEDLIAERNNFRVAIGTTWTVLGKRLTLPVFRLLRTYILSHGGFRTLSLLVCKMRARRRNSTYLRYDPDGGGKGRSKGRGRVRSLSRLCDPFSLLSRVMLPFSRCVCYSTVKEYRFCTSRWVRDN